MKQGEKRAFVCICLSEHNEERKKWQTAAKKIYPTSTLMSHLICRFKQTTTCAALRSLDFTALPRNLETRNKQGKSTQTLLITCLLIKKALGSTWFELEIIVFICALLAHFPQLLFPTQKLFGELQNLLRCLCFFFFFFFPPSSQCRCVSVVCIVPHGVQAAREADFHYTSQGFLSQGRHTLTRMPVDVLLMWHLLCLYICQPGSNSGSGRTMQFHWPGWITK